MILKIRQQDGVPSVPSPVVLSWRDEFIEESITDLGIYVESLILGQIQWYYQKKCWKSRFSRGLRLASLALFALGGSVPVLHAALPELAMRAGPFGPFDFGHVGYLLMAAAAACIGFDRFFGFSSGWMRYMTTALSLEAILEQFRLDWTERTARLRGRPPAEKEMLEIIQLCQEVSVKVRAEVERETMAWVAEFQSSLARMEQEFRQRSEKRK